MCDDCGEGVVSDHSVHCGGRPLFNEWSLVVSECNEVVIEWAVNDQLWLVSGG